MSDAEMIPLPSEHLRVRCACWWEGERCPNDATQEDGLCDWCGTRTPEQLRDNPKACWSPEGKYLGLGGAGELHDFPLTKDENGRTREGKSAACWYPFSGRVVQGRADDPHMNIGKNKWRDGTGPMGDDA